MKPQYWANFPITGGRNRILVGEGGGGGSEVTQRGSELRIFGLIFIVSFNLPIFQNIGMARRVDRSSCSLD